MLYCIRPHTQPHLCFAFCLRFRFWLALVLLRAGGRGLFVLLAFLVLLDLLLLLVPRIIR